MFPPHFQLQGELTMTQAARDGRLLLAGFVATFVGAFTTCSLTLAGNCTVKFATCVTWGPGAANPYPGYCCKNDDQVRRTYRACMEGENNNGDPANPGLNCGDLWREDIGALGILDCVQQLGNDDCGGHQAFGGCAEQNC
jgi:hypothetical protein